MLAIFPACKGSQLPFEPHVNKIKGGIFVLEKKYKFTVRLSEKERKILNTKSKSLNISQNKFLKNALYFDEKKIYELNKNTIEILKLSRYISNNLNQIAKKVNSVEHLQEGFDYVESLEELWRSLRQ